MSILTIVASITAKEGKAAIVKAELEKLMKASPSDEGCLTYKLHRDIDNPDHFLFYENWSSNEHFNKHMEQPHIAEYVKATEGLLEQFKMYKMVQVES